MSGTTIGLQPFRAPLQARATEKPDLTPAQTKQLASSDKAKKILIGAMIGLPIVLGASLLGVRGLDKFVASAAQGPMRTFASGSATALAGVGAISGIGAVLAVTWGPFGLIAASKERAEILEGK